jgi:hypothetical protein
MGEFKGEFEPQGEKTHQEIDELMEQLAQSKGAVYKGSHKPEAREGQSQAWTASFEKGGQTISIGLDATGQEVSSASGHLKSDILG